MASLASVSYVCSRFELQNNSISSPHVFLHGKMEKIGEVTSDEPFLLVSAIRSSSPFPVQIVSLKYNQVKLCVSVPRRVNGPRVANMYCTVTTCTEAGVQQE